MMITASATQCAAKTKPSNIWDVLIIGGGLSGLMIANELQKLTAAQSSSSSPVSWKLLEARDTLGGRLVNDGEGKLIDLGGAWIWPQHQPHMKQLVRDLEIPTFPQPDDPSSTRLEGGAVELIHKLASTLPSNTIELNSPVQKCSIETLDGEDVIRVETSRSNDQEEETASELHFARRLVFAAPPRVLSKHVSFNPPLSNAKQKAMSASNTWMAGVTKVALGYKTRFWSRDVSNMGLPQYLGPAFQVYDASTRNGDTPALTFFTIVPPGSPALRDDAILAKQCATQMGKVWQHYGFPEFAKQATEYTDIHIKRWPLESYLSEDSSPTRIQPHPEPMSALSTPEWGNRLFFAGTESDLRSPGVMEGAIGAALRVVRQLQEALQR